MKMMPHSVARVMGALSNLAWPGARKKKGADQGLAGNRSAFPTSPGSSSWSFSCLGWWVFSNQVRSRNFCSALTYMAGADGLVKARSFGGRGALHAKQLPSSCALSPPWVRRQKPAALPLEGRFESKLNNTCHWGEALRGHWMALLPAA